MLIFVPIDIFLGLKNEVNFLIFAIAIQAILLFIKPKPQYLYLKYHLLHAFSLFVVFGFIFIQGGLTSPVVMFISTPLISSYITFGMKSGKVYSAIALFSTTIIFMLTLTESMPFGIREPDVIQKEAIMFFSCLMGSFADVFYTIKKYETEHNLYQNEIQEQQKELLQQQEEIRQQQEEMIATQEKEIELAHLEIEKEKAEKGKVEAQEKLLEVENSLKYASKIQTTLLPEKKQLKDLFAEFTIYYKPQNIVSGDFYYVNDYGKISLVVVGDCTGHGISASLLSVVIMGYLEGIVTLPHFPSDLLTELHITLIQRLNQSFDTRYSQNNGAELTIMYITDNKILYSSANGKLMKINPKGHEILPTTNRSVGGFLRESKAFRNHTLELSPDDIVVMYTDGFIDQPTKDGSKVGSIQFATLCETFYRKYGDNWNEIIKDYSEKHFIEKQRDDITILAFNLN